MSIDGMAREWLPLNRKERYYTATVLPQIICADDFRYFGRFLSMVGIEGYELRTDPGNTNIQFFTEYNLCDSLRYEGSEKDFAKLPEANDTPDLLIMLGEPAPALIVIEAKMLTSPQPRGLVSQIRRQEKHVAAYLREHRGPFRPVLAALLPSSYADDVEASREDLSDIRILRWEQVLGAFRDVASARYFVGTLEVALARHARLLSRRAPGGANKDENMLGSDIVDGFRAGTLPFGTMGCQGGIKRAAREDCPLGRWRSHSYEVSLSKTPANGNWFEIARFVRLVETPEGG